VAPTLCATHTAGRAGEAPDGPGLTLMRPSFVKRQTTPMERFFSFFPLPGFRRGQQSVSCTNLISVRGANHQRGCTKHLLRFYRHGKDDCRAPLELCSAT